MLIVILVCKILLGIALVIAALGLWFVTKWWLQETPDQRQMRKVLKPLFKNQWMWNRRTKEDFTIRTKDVNLRVCKSVKYVGVGLLTRKEFGRLEVDGVNFQTGKLLGSLIESFVEKIEKQHQHDLDMAPVQKVAQGLLDSQQEITKREIDWRDDKV